MLGGEKVNDRVSFLYPPECDPAQEVRMKSFDFIQALQIDDMVVLQNDRYRGYSDLTLENFFQRIRMCCSTGRRLWKIL